MLTMCRAGLENKQCNKTFPGLSFSQGDRRKYKISTKYVGEEREGPSLLDLLFLKPDEERLLKTWPPSPASWSSDASFSVPSLEPRELSAVSFGENENAMWFGINPGKQSCLLKGAKVALIIAQGLSQLRCRHFMLADRWTHCSLPHVVETYRNFRPVKKGLPFTVFYSNLFQ